MSVSRESSSSSSWGTSSWSCASCKPEPALGGAVARLRPPLMSLKYSHRWNRGQRSARLDSHLQPRSCILSPFKVVLFANSCLTSLILSHLATGLHQLPKDISVSLAAKGSTMFTSKLLTWRAFPLKTAASCSRRRFESSESEPKQ